MAPGAEQEARTVAAACSLAGSCRPSSGVQRVTTTEYVVVCRSCRLVEEICMGSNFPLASCTVAQPISEMNFMQPPKTLLRPRGGLRAAGHIGRLSGEGHPPEAGGPCVSNLPTRISDFHHFSLCASRS